MVSHCRRSVFALFLLLTLPFAACGENGKSGSSSSSASASGASSSSSSLFAGAEPGSEITIAVFNAEDFRTVGQQPEVDDNKPTFPNGTFAAVADFIEANAIDIIVFNECSPWDARQLSSELALRGLSMDYRITSTRTSEPQSDDIFDDEISIFSRFAITHFSQILRGYYNDPVSGASVNAPRYILRARADVGGRPFWFYGAHLKATSTGTLTEDIKRRRAQAHALEAHIKANHNPATDYIVVLGDMNTTEREGEDNEFAEFGSTMACLTLKCDNPGNPDNDFTAVNVAHLPMPGGYTWAPYYGTTLQPSLLDHILLSPALSARYVPDSVNILLKGIAPRISDHYPVMLKIAPE